MQTTQSDKYGIHLPKNLTAITAKLGKIATLLGRKTIILATATCMMAACAAVLIECRSSDKPPKYTAEQWQYMKHKSRSTGSK